MSVDAYVYLVDWPAFQAGVRHGEASEVLDEDLGVEPAWDGPLSASMDFLNDFDQFRRAWKADERYYFQEVFDTLFWSWRGEHNRVFELVEGDDPDSDLNGVDTAMSPETAAEFAATASRFDLEACRPLYEQHVSSSHRFESFDEWKSFGQEWLDLLHRAATERKGLDVIAFG